MDSPAALLAIGGMVGFTVGLIVGGWYGKLSMVVGVVLVLIEAVVAWKVLG